MSRSSTKCETLHSNPCALMQGLNHMFITCYSVNQFLNSVGEERFICLLTFASIADSSIVKSCASIANSSPSIPSVLHQWSLNPV